MYSRLFVLILISFFFTGCKSESAYDYNQKLVEIENSLVSDIGRTEDLVSKYAGTGEYDSIAAVSNAMAELVESKIAEVKEMPVPKAREGETFKKAYIRYFEYLKSVYISYRDVGLEETEEGREEQREKMLKLIQKKEQVIRELQGIQRQYAKANGFQMESVK
jgi:hypothetical protein